MQFFLSFMGFMIKCELGENSYSGSTKYPSGDIIGFLSLGHLVLILFLFLVLELSHI